MAETNGMALAIELATGKRDALAQRLGQVRQQWVGAQLQLDQLESYAQETTARWGAQPGRCAPEIMRHHYQFMERLVHAIRLQTGVVAEHAGNVSREAQGVREAEARLEALRQLHAQRERELLLARLRREQKQSDELAATQRRRPRDSSFAGFAA
jgi:flagellar FliJ protein